MRSVSWVIVSVLLASGCARHQVKGARPPARPAVDSATPQGLEAFMAKFRAAQSEARPASPVVPTLEGSDPGLAAALAAAAAAPSASTFRAVAEAYRRLAVVDKAHVYYNRALAIHSKDAASYDGLARLWRDSGHLAAALSDAHRAVYYAPAAAGPRNTLGTVLQALGYRQLARVEYERALRLKPDAAYALTNLCYSWVLDGDAQKAGSACQHALALQPELTAASNNLALAQAVAGDYAGAKQTFQSANDPAVAFYNAGIIELARRDFAAALKSFEAARALRPTMVEAATRARQTTDAALATGSGQE